MGTKLIYIIIISSCLLTSCSVYKSSGRSSFEDKSSTNLPAVSTQAVAENENQWSADEESTKDNTEDSDDCWNQPEQDPLWQVADSDTMTVKKINSQQIQVCLIKNLKNTKNP